MHGLTRSSGRDATLPRNAVSGIGCVAFSVAVSMLCHVAVCVLPPPFSSGLGTGNGGVNIYTLKKILKTLNSKISSGILDGILNIAIKNLLDNILIGYTILFNNILNNYHFPEKWKTART